MRSLRRLVVVVATIVALTVLVPSVSAASQKAFHLEKFCDTGTHCTVTFSSFPLIPVGTEITYSGPDADHLVAVVTVKGSTLTGQCAIQDVIDDATNAGICSFETGTRRFSQFHLGDVAVTRTEDFSLWFWDGTYSFGPGD